MSTLPPPDRQPDARVAIESGESMTDALMRAAKKTEADLTGPGAWMQDLVDGHALDRLFLEPDPESGGQATLVLDLWGYTFALTPGTVEVYRSDAESPHTSSN
mgnify:CR=1 FL=1